VCSRWTPTHLLLFAQSMIDQMIHHGFDVCGGNAVSRGPLFCEMREASTISAHIISKLFDDLLRAPNRLSAAPRVLNRPPLDVSAQPRKLEKRQP
jgi:hypothetical protein